MDAITTSPSSANCSSIHYKPAMTMITMSSLRYSLCYTICVFIIMHVFFIHAYKIAKHRILQSTAYISYIKQSYTLLIKIMNTAYQLQDMVMTVCEESDLETLMGGWLSHKQMSDAQHKNQA